MAEARPLGPLRDSDGSNLLNYGHLGTATYLENTQSWSFLRRNASDIQTENVSSYVQDSWPVFPFKLIESSVKVVNDGRSSDETEINDPALSYEGYHTFLKHLPDVVSGLSQARLEYTTRPQHFDSNRHVSSNVSERLAFGSAVSLSEMESKAEGTCVPIAVFVAGTNSQSIKLVRIGREQLSLDPLNHPREKLVLPHISKMDEALWTGNGEKVQQICFAAATGRLSTWLAVRQPSSTTLLHPLLHRMLVPARYTSNGVASPEHRVSRLDANPILTLPMSRTGGHPHADVAFHPSDHRKLAIVDEHGNWSIWQLHGTRSITSRVLYRIHLQHSGKIYTWKLTERPVDVSPYYDGWHRLLWLRQSTHNTHGLLVCNRQIAAVHSMFGEMLGLANMHMGLIREGQWILDIKRSASHQGRCFVLTSTRVLLMSAADEHWADPENNNVLSTLLSWRHFRSRADSTIRLALLEMPRACTVFIYSKVNKVVTAFRVGMDVETPLLPVSLADPVQIDLPRGPFAYGHLASNVDFMFRELQVRRVTEEPVDHEQTTFFKLFIQSDSSQITEALYQSTNRISTTTSDIPYSTVVSLPLVRSLSVKSRKYAEVDELEDFIIADEPLVLLERHRLQEVLRQPAEERRIAPRAELFQWNDISELVGEENRPQDSSQRSGLSFIVSRIETRTKRLADSDSPLILLLEAANADVYLPDVEEASTELSSFFEALETDIDGKIELIRLRAPHQKWKHTMTLLERYNNIFTSWIVPLPAQIPDLIRVSRERLARSVAIDLVLAGSGLRRTIQSPLPVVTDAYHTEPVLRHSDADEGEPASSHASPYPNSTTIESAHIARLRTLTTITNANPVSTTASATLEDVLTHLPTSITTSPSTYSWRATELSLAAHRASESAAQLDPKARRRAERRTEVQRRRVERQNQLSQAALEERNRLVPMVLDTRVPSHSPVHTQLPVQVVQSSPLPTRSSQSQIMSPHVNATQPESGTVGGQSRMSVLRKGKGKKQERKRGF